MEKNTSLVKAINKNVRTSPRKLALVCNFIKGKKADVALRDLEFSRKRIAKEVSKTVKSAISNAENNNQFEIEIHDKLGYFDFVTTLIHELVHVDQTLRGLFDDQKRENEAYILEKKLGKKFMLENEPCKVF